MFKGSIEQFSDSIQPVITKVKPYDEGFFFENIRENHRQEMDGPSTGPWNHNPKYTQTVKTIVDEQQFIK